MPEGGVSSSPIPVADLARRRAAGNAWRLVAKQGQMIDELVSQNHLMRREIAASQRYLEWMAARIALLEQQRIGE